MMAVVGGGILALIIWFYGATGKHFWLYAWALVAVFTLFMNMFYYGFNAVYFILIYFKSITIRSFRR